MKVAHLLSEGAENGVPLQMLMAYTGLSNRQVREIITKERLMGIPILSDNRHGYYLPATDEERDRFCRSMQHRAKEIMRVVNAVRG